MTEAEIEAELRRLARQVRALGVKAARYDIREFILLMQFRFLYGFCSAVKRSLTVIPGRNCVRAQE